MELQHVWLFYVRAASRRQGGMGPNPLLATEVEKLAEQLCFPLNAWLYDLIYRLDDAALSAGRDEPAAGSSDKSHTEIPVNDVQSIREMVKARAATIRLVAEHRAQAAAEKAAKARPPQTKP